MLRRDWLFQGPESYSSQKIQRVAVREGDKSYLGKEVKTPGIQISLQQSVELAGKYRAKTGNALQPLIFYAETPNSQYQIRYSSEHSNWTVKWGRKDSQSLSEEYKLESLGTFEVKQKLNFTYLDAQGQKRRVAEDTTVLRYVVVDPNDPTVKGLPVSTISEKFQKASDDTKATKPQQKELSPIEQFRQRIADQKRLEPERKQEAAAGKIAEEIERQIWGIIGEEQRMKREAEEQERRERGKKIDLESREDLEQYLQDLPGKIDLTQTANDIKNTQWENTKGVPIHVEPINEPPLKVDDYIDIIKGVLTSVVGIKLSYSYEDVSIDTGTVSADVDWSYRNVSVHTIKNELYFGIGNWLVPEAINSASKAELAWIKAYFIGGSRIGHLQPNIAPDVIRLPRIIPSDHPDALNLFYTYLFEIAPEYSPDKFVPQAQYRIYRERSEGNLK